MWYLILGSLVAGAVAGTGTGVAVMPWNLPVFPATSPPPRPLHLKFERNETVSEVGRAYAKKIPRLLWIAVRDAKDKLSFNLNYQMLPLFNRNPLWDVHIAGEWSTDEPLHVDENIQGIYLMKFMMKSSFEPTSSWNGTGLYAHEKSHLTSPLITQPE